MSLVAELKNGTDEYAELIDKDVADAISRMDGIDLRIMREAIAEKFAPKMEVEKLLRETTAMYGFFVTKFRKWKAIQENREVEAYIRIKENTVSQGLKFVSAPAERAAAHEVRPVNYLVGVFEGNTERCAQYINTSKKLLESYQQEGTHENS